jgi:hypothetical protein
MNESEIKIEIGGQRNLDGWTNLGVRDNDFDIILNDIPYPNTSCRSVVYGDSSRIISEAFALEI